MLQTPPATSLQQRHAPMKKIWHQRIVMSNAILHRSKPNSPSSALPNKYPAMHLNKRESADR
jgi:hypothetical protein